MSVKCDDMGTATKKHIFCSLLENVPVLIQYTGNQFLFIVSKHSLPNIC